MNYLNIDRKDAPGETRGAASVATSLTRTRFRGAPPGGRFGPRASRGCAVEKWPTAGMV